jgi:hypothetical protein
VAPKHNDQEVVSGRLESRAEDRARFSDTTRRRIARVVRDEALGAYAIGREIGRGVNTIRDTLDKMVTAGTLVVSESESDSRERGLYRLADGLGTALDEALEGAHGPGVIQRGQLMMLVRAGSAAELVASVTPASVSGALLWSVRLGPCEMLLTFESDAGDFVLDQLGARLTGRGMQVEQFQARDVLSARAFIAQGRSLRQAGQTQPVEHGG